MFKFTFILHLGKKTDDVGRDKYLTPETLDDRLTCNPPGSEPITLCATMIELSCDVGRRTLEASWSFECSLPLRLRGGKILRSLTVCSGAPPQPPSFLSFSQPEMKTLKKSKKKNTTQLSYYRRQNRSDETNNTARRVLPRPHKKMQTRTHTLHTKHNHT
jgi:hypothetical protein